MPESMKVAVAETEGLHDSAAALAERLDLPLFADPVRASEQGFRFVLSYEQQRLSLRLLDAGAPGAVCVDFESGPLDYRRRHHGSPEAILKAIGLKAAGHTRDDRPRVIDATAGLGQDSFIMAAAGCELQLIERSALLAELLEDGLRRAMESDSAPVRQAAGRMHLHRGDARECLPLMPEAQVIYLDPMFPDRRKSARVKKGLFVLQKLLHAKDESEADSNAAATGLLELALRFALKRVVVKRPRHASYLEECKADFELSGRSSRFDVYLSSNRRRMPS